VLHKYDISKAVQADKSNCNTRNRLTIVVRVEMFTLLLFKGRTVFQYGLHFYDMTPKVRGSQAWNET